MIRYRSARRRPARIRIHRTRSGMLLAIVLVALLVVMLLGAALANAFLAQRQFARRNQQQMQAFWLAESALHRAVYRIENEADYRGETWHVPAELLDGKHAGEAVVRVATLSQPAAGRQITVDARYPSSNLKQTLQHRRLFVAQRDGQSN